MSREMVALARLPFITRLMCEGERRINLENSLMLIGSGDVFTFIRDSKSLICRDS